MLRDLAKSTNQRSILAVSTLIAVRYHFLRPMPGIPIVPLVLGHALWRNLAAVFLDAE